MRLKLWELINSTWSVVRAFAAGARDSMSNKERTNFSHFIRVKHVQDLKTNKSNPGGVFARLLSGAGYTWDNSNKRYSNSKGEVVFGRALDYMATMPAYWPLVTVTITSATFVNLAIASWVSKSASALYVYIVFAFVFLYTVLYIMPARFGDSGAALSLRHRAWRWYGILSILVGFYAIYDITAAYFAPAGVFENNHFWGDLILVIALASSWAITWFLVRFTRRLVSCVSRWDEGGEAEFAERKKTFLRTKSARRLSALTASLLEILFDIFTGYYFVSALLALTVACRGVCGFTAASARNASSRFGDTLMRCLRRIEFGLAYLVVLLVTFFIFNTTTPLQVSREGFSTFACFEIAFLFALLICFLTYFGSLRRGGLSPLARAELVGDLCTSTWSLFTAQSILYLANYVAYRYALSNDFTRHLFLSFHNAGYNLHAQEFGLLLFKILYLMLCMVALRMFYKYLRRRVISFQYFCLVTLMMWTGLFLIGISNFFYIMLLFDSLTIMTAAVVALSATEGNSVVEKSALSYLVLSVITSLGAYAGCLMLYITFKSFNCNTIVFMVTRRVGHGSEVALLLNSPAAIIGITLLLIKFLFLFAAVPFQHYLMEITSRVNYAFLFYFLVISKFPVIFATILLLKLVWVGNSTFYCTLLFVAGLATNIYGSYLMVRCEGIKSFFALSSLTQTGMFLTLLLFDDLIGVHLALLTYFIYAVAISAPFLFIASVHNFFGSHKEVDIEHWSDFARVVSDSFSYYSIVSLSADRERTAHGGAWMFYFFGVAVSSISILVIAGFPPLAGFFLKLHATEVFLAHKHYVSLAVVLLLSLFTMYAYYGVFGLHFSKPGGTPAAARAYLPRLSKPAGLDFVFFMVILLIMMIMSLMVPNSTFFWSFSAEATVFFSENNYYVFNALLEQASSLATTTSDAARPRGGLFMSAFILGSFFKKYNEEEEKEYRRRIDLKVEMVREFVAKRKKAAEGRSGGPSYLQDGGPFSPYRNELMFKIFTSKTAMTFLGGTVCAEAAIIIWLSAISLFILELVTELPYFSDGWWMMMVVSFLMYYYAILLFVFASFWSRALRTPGWFDSGINEPIPMLMARSIVGACSMFYLNAYYQHRDMLHFVYRELPGVMDNALYGLGIDSKVVFELITFPGEEWYFIYTLVFVMLCLLSTRVYSVYYFYDILAKFNLQKDLYYNLEILLEYNRAYSDIRFKWYSYRADKFFFILGLLIFVGPFLSSAELAVSAGTWGVAAVKAAYICLALITGYWTFVSLAVCVALGHVFYCWVFGTLKIKWLRRRLRLIGRPFAVYVKEPKRFLKALTYMVIAVWVPMYVVYGRLQGGLAAGFFKATVGTVQLVILNVWPIMLLAVLYFGFGWSKRRENDFALAVFYLSSVVSLWLINMNYFYESPAKIYYSLLSLGKGSKHERVFEILRGEEVFPDYILRILPKTDLVFGYDCLSLTLAATTSIIFSMVYLGTAFEQRTENKKLFVTLLLLTQVGTLVAFLSLNILCFVVAFESTLVPMALLVRNWGSSQLRFFAAKQFLFYSVTASLPALVGLVKLYAVFGTLDYLFIHKNLGMLDIADQCLLFLAFSLMFVTKIPMTPLHSWLLNAHVEAPTAGSIVLAAILLKLGIFGFIRYGLGLFYSVSLSYSTWFVVLATLGFLYSALSAVSETDLKRIVALTSVAHMNLAIIGIFSFDLRGLYGAALLAVGHAVVSAALFFLVGMLYSRFHSRDIAYYGGLATVMPIFSSFLFFFAMANTGFPWSLSFLGELLILVTVANTWGLLLFAVLAFGNVLLLYANVRLFTSVCFGTLNKNFISNATPDATHMELLILLVLVFNALGLLWGCDVFFSSFVWDYIDMFEDRKKK